MERIIYIIIQNVMYAFNNYIPYYLSKINPSQINDNYDFNIHADPIQVLNNEHKVIRMTR